MCTHTHTQGVGKDIEVPIIGDLRERFIIDSLALYVLRDGCAIEQVCCASRSVHVHTHVHHRLSGPAHTHTHTHARVCTIKTGLPVLSDVCGPFFVIALPPLHTILFYMQPSISCLHFVSWLMPDFLIFRYTTLSRICLMALAQALL